VGGPLVIGVPADCYSAAPGNGPARNRDGVLAAPCRSRVAARSDGAARRSLGEQLTGGIAHLSIE
jgi:hypothetical protein